MKGVLFLALLALGCGGRPSPIEASPGAAFAAPSGVKLLHQIMFDHAGDVQVFDGYMITDGTRLLVKAFAGPGVDLFTVVRDGAKHKETLYIQGLADRMDMPSVGADIARVYLGGCVPRAAATSSRCDFFGEPMTETRDAAGRLVRRAFPQAHGIGLEIRYREYESASNQPWSARLIELTWGQSQNRMVIRLVGHEALPTVDPALFRIAP